MGVARRSLGKKPRLRSEDHKKVESQSESLTS
jgi:hypothetical protein